MTAVMTSFLVASRTAFLTLLCIIAAPSLAQGGGTSGADLSKVVPVSEPVLGRLQIFEDWAVGCDNRLSCSAVSLTPENLGTPYDVLVSIQRDGGPAGAALLRLMGADRLRGKIELVIDGRIKAKPTAAKDIIELKGPAALDIIRALGSSFAFELRDRTRAVIGAPSLLGLPAALRYMDEQQGRIGGRAALAAVGEGPDDLARPLPPVAQIPANIPMLATATAPALTADELAAARRLALCEAGVEAGSPLEAYSLGESQALILMPCDAGAYNVSAVPLVTQGAAGHRQFHIAQFDHVPGSTGDASAPPLLVNARWNGQRGELSSFAKGRGLGDCGTAETYRWDGARFRLIEARSMPVCRGAWEWPVIYSAAVGKTG